MVENYNDRFSHSKKENGSVVKNILIARILWERYRGRSTETVKPDG